MARARFLVRGRVQGVGFRWFVVRLAERLDLAGLVRNLPDGAVEVMAEGGTASLAELEQALRQGPRMARVDAVDKSDVPHEINLAKPFSDY
jgi:acylphosphatase